MKEYEELRLQDDFMFCKILQENEDLCKDLTELIIGKAANSNLTSRIDSKVREAIEKKLWRKEYMTYKEQMDAEFKRGEEKGIEKGADKINRLNQILIEAGRLEDLKRAASDKEFQNKLISELVPKKT